MLSNEMYTLFRKGIINNYVLKMKLDIRILPA